LEVRGRVAKELVSTEKTYCSNLEMIVSEFVNPIKVDSMLKKAQLEKIFINIEEITQLHLPILYDMEKCIANWDQTSTIGKIFSSLVPYLSLYKDYCANYHEGLMCLEERTQNSTKLQAFLTSKKEQLGTDLSSLLIQPVQRIPRYRLLFAELLKNTPTSHPDYEVSRNTLVALEGVAQFVNESVRAKENQDKLLQVQQSLTGSKIPTIVDPNRKFVREGVLVKMCRRVPKRRYFFLFSDLLVYGTVNESSMGTGKTTYTFHRAVNLHDVKIENLPDTEDNLSNAFQILSKQKSFAVFAESKEDKASWMDDFRLATSISVVESEKKSKSDNAPVWVPDKLLKTCMLCNGKFTTINRRHHCRKCGKLVCGSCSGKKFKLPNIGKMCRVCDECYELFTGNAPVTQRKTSHADTDEMLQRKQNLARTAKSKFRETDGQIKGGNTVYIPQSNSYNTLVSPEPPTNAPSTSAPKNPPPPLPKKRFVPPQDDTWVPPPINEDGFFEYNSDPDPES